MRTGDSLIQLRAEQGGGVQEGAPDVRDERNYGGEGVRRESLVVELKFR